MEGAASASISVFEAHVETVVSYLDAFTIRSGRGARSARSASTGILDQAVTSA